MAVELPTASEFIELIRSVKSLLDEERDCGEVGKGSVIGSCVVFERGEFYVASDIHGDLDTLLALLSRVRDDVESGKRVIVFLGDYGDRGYRTPEVWYLILKFKLECRGGVVLLRGNHEFPPYLPVFPYDTPYYFRRVYGDRGDDVVAELESLFQKLHLTCLVKGRVFMVHGGPPSKAESFEDIANAHKNPALLEEILWNDPEEDVEWTAPSPRGAGVLFGPKVTEKALGILGVKAIVRGHTPCEGYMYNHGYKVLTIFTRRGPPYMNSVAAYAYVPDTELKDARGIKVLTI